MPGVCPLSLAAGLVRTMLHCEPPMPNWSGLTEMVIERTVPLGWGTCSMMITGTSAAASAFEGCPEIAPVRGSIVSQQGNCCAKVY